MFETKLGIQEEHVFLPRDKQLIRQYIIDIETRKKALHQSFVYTQHLYYVVAYKATTQ